MAAAAAADAVDVRAVNAIVREAVQGINVNQNGQTLTLHGGATSDQEQQQQQQPLLPTLTHHDMQFVVNLLLRYPLAVEKLVMEFWSLTRRAVHVLRGHFTHYTRTRKMPGLRIMHLKQVNLGNVNGGLLLSGLHGNNSVMDLDLDSIGLEGRAGGAILSTLLQHNPSLNTLYCYNLRLGVDGARALQASLRENRTVIDFGLSNCELEDEGATLIADALLDRNIPMLGITLKMNGITTSCLPHITRLLPLVRAIAIDCNPGLFDDQEKFGQFLSALQNSEDICCVSLNGCQLPGHQVTALFQALSSITGTTILCVFDSIQLQGTDLMHLLEIIPLMKNLQKLGINLDFMNEAVLNSFHRNTCIQDLFACRDANVTPEVLHGPVSLILKRNRWLDSTSTLLASSEPQQTVPLGLWSKAMERLTHDDSTGVTAVYKIMQEKLAMWCAPDQAAVSMTNTVASTAAPSSETDAGLLITEKNDDTNKASPSATSATTTNNNSTVVVKKRSYAQANNAIENDNDDEAPPRKKQDF